MTVKYDTVVNLPFLLISVILLVDVVVVVVVVVGLPLEPIPTTTITDNIQAEYVYDGVPAGMYSMLSLTALVKDCPS